MLRARVGDIIYVNIPRRGSQSFFLLDVEINTTNRNHDVCMTFDIFESRFVTLYRRQIDEVIYGS
jgi:hypothetical protein